MRPNKEHHIKPEAEKTCDCGPECTCGCNEGKECNCRCNCHACGCHNCQKCGGKWLGLLLAFLLGIGVSHLWNGCAFRCPAKAFRAPSAAQAPLPTFTDGAGTVIIINAADGHADVMRAPKPCHEHFKPHHNMHKPHHGKDKMHIDDKTSSLHSHKISPKAGVVNQEDTPAAE